MNAQRSARYYYLKFRRTKGDPQSLAMGTAIGIFLGIVPIMPLKTITIVFTTVATRASTIAAMLASCLICNPLTYIPLYFLSTIIGNVLTPYQLSWQRIKEVLDFLLESPGMYNALIALAGLGYEAMIVLLVGGAVLALPFTIISYFLSLRFFGRIKKRRQQKHLLQLAKISSQPETSI